MLGVAGIGTAIVAVLALLLSDAYIQRARSEINNPRSELSSARTAHTLDPWSITPHYLKASAIETLGDRPGADTQLQHALSLEPANKATLAVLGDFEARGHHFAAARQYYRRALKLDPLDTGLQQLVRIGERRASRPAVRTGAVGSDGVGERRGPRLPGALGAEVRLRVGAPRASLAQPTGGVGGERADAVGQ